MFKKWFKRNSHNLVFKALSGFGRSINRLYENRNHDIESNGELTILQKLSTLKPTVIVDGGANKGNYSLWANKYCPASNIYAFEPVNETFEKLKENTKDKKCIFCINQGLFNAETTKAIHLFSSDTHASVFDIKGLSYPSVGTTEISLIRGDQFFKERNIQHIDLLKLDLEGAEFEALMGFKEMIKAGSIRMIQFEYGYINITTKKLLLDFYQFFQEYDYIVGKVFPKKVAFRDYHFKYEDFLGPNHVAIRKSDTSLIRLLS